MVSSTHGDEIRDLNDLLQLRVTDPVVPEDIANYLSGIGGVSDFAGEPPWVFKIGVELRTTLINGLSGHYGKVDAYTHI